MNDLISAEDNIMVFKEQLKVGLWFSIDSLFVDVLRFHKRSVAQLHLNSWKILVVLRFICLNNYIESSMTLFFQLYQLGSRKNEEF